MKTKRKKRIILFIIIILLVVISLLSLYFINKNNKDNLSNNNDNNNQQKPNEKIKEETFNVDLIMVGDALIHDAIYKSAYNSSTKTYDFKPMLELIKPIVSEYDLAFYNQETILGGKELGLSSYPSFNSPYEVGDAFIDAGFNLISTATNHTYDKKEKAIINSYNYWNSKDVIMSGTNSNAIESRIKIFEKNNIKFAFVAYTKKVNFPTLPTGKEYLVNVWDEEQIKSDIESVRDKVDFVIFSTHWGKDVTSYTNPSAEPWDKSPYNKGSGNNPKEQAAYLASLGVDLVIGHHPHIINPVEWIDDTLVFYSLGNFISAQSSDSNYNKRIGLMGSVEFSKTIKGEETIEKKLISTDNELVYTYISNGKYKAIPFSQMNSSYNSNYKSLYEKYSNVVKMYDSSLKVKEIN